MSYMDLHLHSSVSLDGEISPRRLAELCRQEGVRFAALTDHNAVSGTQEFSWRGAQLGVRVIPGIEIDCMAEDLHLHMLGYGIDSANDELVKLEHTVKEMQRAASVEQMDALENLGIFLDRDALMEQAKDGVISGKTSPSAAAKPRSFAAAPVSAGRYALRSAASQFLLGSMFPRQKSLCSDFFYLGKTSDSTYSQRRRFGCSGTSRDAAANNGK